MTDSFQSTPNPGDRPLSPDLNLESGEGAGRWLDIGFGWVVRIMTFGTVAIMGWMAVVMFQKALPAIQTFGLPFLWQTDWDIGNLKFGALPYIYGTLVTSTIALLIAVPVGLAVALLTSENFLPIWVRSPLAFLVELIAAIPSVIIGLWGIFTLADILVPISEWLWHHFQWIPLFSTEPLGQSMVVAGIVLAIMVLPTMAAISREVFLAVPSELRAASGALGATRWETIFRIMLPTGISGFLGAATLALGRALGETMAVTMVIGNTPQISASLFDPASTIPAVLANQFSEALDELHIGALLYLALILFIVTLVVNAIAVSMVRALGQFSISPSRSVRLN